MHRVLVIITSILIFNELRVLCRAIRTFNYIKDQTENSPSIYKVNKQLYILLPLYQEDSIMNESISYFSKVFNESNLIYIVGNEKRMQGELNSYELIKNIMGENSKATVLKDPSLNSTKSSKLNYAIKYLDSKCEEDIYIGVYDFDARPSLKTLSYLTKNIQLENSAMCYQQIPLVLENINYKNILVSSYSVFSLRRSLGLEGLPLISKDKKEKTIEYLMGSGMFLQKSLLEQIDGFSVNSDDIETGYKLNELNITQRILPSFNSVSAVETSYDLINQGKRIFFGAYSYFNKIPNNKSFFEKLWFLLKRTWNPTQEIIFFLVTLMAVIVELSLRRSYFATLLIITVYISLSIAYHILHFYLKRSLSHTNKENFLITKLLFHSVLTIFLPWIVRLILFICFLIDCDIDRLLLASSSKRGEG